MQIPETGSAYMANRRTYGINTLSSDSKIFQHWLDNNYTCLTAARTSDGSLVIAYMPSIRRITVDMSKLTAISTARWYDPTNGEYTDVSGSPFANRGSRQFNPPGKNSAGDGDWVLVIEAPIARALTGTSRFSIPMVAD